MKLATITLSACTIFSLATCNITDGGKKNITSNSGENHTHEHAKPVDYMSAYSIVDLDHGTKTTMTIKGDMRIMTTNALPNHATGNFPNEHNPNTIKAQNVTYKFPLKPINSGKATWAREPGIALNGIKFEPETAEQVVCESGEHFRIEAKQGLLNFGLDENNAHVQPTGAYHYHGVPKTLVEQFDNGSDLVHMGFAKDGFPIYYSKSGAYKPSYVLKTETRAGVDCNYNNPHDAFHYEMDGTSPDGVFVSDWEYQKGLGDLDQCNGIIVEGKYIYLLTDTYPYVGRCLMGEFKESHPQGPPPGGNQKGKPSGPPPSGNPPGHTH